MTKINWNGCPPLPRRRFRLRAAIRRAQRKGLVVTATTNGLHAEGSYHYKGRAADLGVKPSMIGTTAAHFRLLEFQHAEYHRTKRWHTWIELLGPCNNHCYLAGSPTKLVEGSALENLHDNHVHVAR